MNKKTTHQRHIRAREKLTVNFKFSMLTFLHPSITRIEQLKKELFIAFSDNRRLIYSKKIIFCFFFILSSVKGFSQEKKVYIDFGPNDITNGAITPNPDVNGNYWNNAIQPTTAASALNLVDGKNAGTGISLKILGNFSTNGILNGGLLAPKAELLGDMAIKTATQDYFFVNGAVGSFKLTGLDPKKKYIFYMFASREATDVRISQYKFTGTNSSTVTLQTTGAAIGNAGYNGNNDKIAKSDFLYADATGTITFELSSKAGSFAYINAMKIEVFDAEEKPKFSLEDGGFESGNLDVWSFSDGSQGQNTVVKSPIRSGSNALKTIGLNESLSQNITYTEGIDYRLSGYLYYVASDALTGDQSALLQLSFYDKDKVLLQSKNSDALSARSTAGEWLKVEVEATVPAGTAFIKAFLIRKSTLTNAGAVYFDDITLEKYTPVNKDWSKLYLDLGPNDVTNGNITKSPDANGSTWNNLSDGNSGARVLLLDASGKFTGATATVSRTFQINGILNGGLLAPKAELLGDMAINTATQDYFYTDGNATISFTGLSKTKKYVFYFLGSRESTETRVSEYRLTGANISAKELTTSGSGIGANGYNGNNNKILVSDAVYPDQNGTVTLNVKKITGAFAHLNAIKITAADKTSDENYSLDNQGFEIGDLSYWTKTAPDAGSVATVDKDTKHTGNFSLLMGGTSFNINQTIIPSEAVTAYKLSGYFFQPAASALTKNQEGYLTISCYDANNNLLTTAKSASVTASSLSGQWIKLTTAITLPKDTKFIKSAVVWSNPEKGNGNVYFDDLALEVYNPLSISYMGSSVPYGQGATNFKGYTSLFTDILKLREAKGGLAWQPVNISVPGDNTVRVLNRYDADLLSQKGKYVVFALALGNEGIHEQGQPAFDQFGTNIKILIDKARSDGYIPVITNSYTRGDYNETDYNYVKRMNMLIHLWNVPSINLLGAVDDLSGRWVNGYWSDALHPNDAGHTELAYTIVPSLFDALERGKPMPKRMSGSQIMFPKNTDKSKAIAFTPENIVHPFTTTVSFKADEAGTLIQIDNASGTGKVAINNNGLLVYTSAVTGSVTGTTKVNDDKWHKLTITHYYAKGQTMVYADSTLQGSLNEKLITTGVKLGGAIMPKNLAFKNWLFYRSGMTLDEVKLVVKDSLLKSSLELYAPLDGKNVSVSDSLINLAQSTNTIREVYSVAPPSGLSYRTPNVFMINNAIIPLEPTVSGTINAYTITPALPAGLSFSRTTGIISGTPTAGDAKASYQVTATNNAGSTTFALVISVLQPLSVKVDSQVDATAFGASDGAVSLTPIGGTGPYQFKLDDGDYVSRSAFSSLVARAYSATVKDADGVSATVAFTIKQPQQTRENQPQITNVFSPNGDGINDNWVLIGIEAYPSHRLTIVDRAGKVVYSVKNYKNEWNGMFNGSYLKEDTYYYSIVFDNNELPTRKGFITIVK